MAEEQITLTASDTASEPAITCASGILSGKWRVLTVR
jgi:hypothetical protein